MICGLASYGRCVPFRWLLPVGLPRSYPRTLLLAAELLRNCSAPLRRTSLSNPDVRQPDARSRAMEETPWLDS